MVKTMEITKVDFRVMDREYFEAGKNPRILNLTEKEYLALKGVGKPDDPVYQKSIEALFSAAYQLKYLLKKKGNDFVVSKLECLWWVEGDGGYQEAPVEEWRWQLLIRIPQTVRKSDVEDAKEVMINEKGQFLAANIELTKLEEGKVVQVMHIGPYGDVGEAYSKLTAFMQDEKLEPNGPFHEVYISDPGRTPEDKLKTIVRQPVK